MKISKIVLFSYIKEVKVTKKQRKKEKTPKFNEKNKHKKPREHIKIFEIKIVKDKKKIILIVY